MNFRKLKILLPIIVSIVILFIIFLKIDVKQVYNLFYNINLIYVLFAVLISLFAILLSAIRWKFITKHLANLSLRESVELTLVGSAFNTITPSKIGDLSKSYALNKKHDVKPSFAFFAFLFEKSLDVFSILFIFLIGMLFISNVVLNTTNLLIVSITIFIIFILIFFVKFEKLKIFRKTISFVFKKLKNKGFFPSLIKELNFFRQHFLLTFSLLLCSLLMWFLYLVQIYVFFLSLNHQISFSLVIGLSPIALLVGMLPITFAGIGTRDSAFLILFSNVAPAPTLISVGLLTTLRFFFPAILGLPFLNKYLNNNRKNNNETKQKK